MTVQETTVKAEYCVGCGICASICPKDCIIMKYNERKEYVPCIQIKECIDCGRCVKYCPHSQESKNQEIAEIEHQSNRLTFGIENATYYWTKDKNEKNVLKSSSGGFVTEFSKEMLDKGIVDAVIHARSRLAKCGEEHFEVLISSSTKELEAGRGSVYGPLCYERILKSLRGKEQKILLIGVPCIIRGIKKVIQDAKEYRGITLYTVALVCSHNVNGQFTDFVGDSLKISKSTPYYVNFRAKDKKMKDCDNYYTCFYDEKRILAKVNRYMSVFTDIWREYYFSLNVCNFCGDFWGREADISVKDAWGDRGYSEKYGSNYLIIRNQQLLEIIKNMRNISIKKVGANEIINGQKSTGIYKQVKLLERMKAGTKENIEYQKYQENSRTSKTLYLEQGYQKCFEYIFKDKENRFSWFDKATIMNCLERIYSEANELQEKIMRGSRTMEEIKCKKKSNNKIVMFGGFCGNNAGDEAQIDESYCQLKERYPDFEVKILSHVQKYTYDHHYNCSVGANSRMALWNADINDDYYDLSDSRKKLIFLWTGFWAYVNAYFMKMGLPTLLLNTKKVSFLEEIRTSNLVFISGGGFLTGDTLSRLWDHLFVVMIADIFSVPCVMSGHTIGLWNSKFTRVFAEKGFSKVKVITTRDPVESIRALKEIGITGENVFCTHDDALFCRKETNIRSMKDSIRLSNETPYVVICPHSKYVSHNDNLRKRIERLKTIINYITEHTDYDVVILPMSQDDKGISEKLYALEKTDRVHIVKQKDYEFKMIRGIIAQAELCITMRHHPIIFAMGERVPVITLDQGKYFVQKNKGALKMFDQEKYSISFEKNDWYEKFVPLFIECIQNKSEIKQKISENLQEVKKQKDKFWKKIDEIVLGK